MKIRPIQHPIPARRQEARRHYGVHPYFTRRPYNVVRQYICHYSGPGQRVLDPFGGSGVTAIEAFLENRHGVHNDINPLANFIAGGIAGLVQGRLEDHARAVDSLRERCASRLGQVEAMPEAEVGRLLKALPLPPNAPLPANSDVGHYHDLFDPRQLACLSILREGVESIDDPAARDAMRLAWSATLAKLNRTFLSAQGRAESRGGSSIFSIYRYKVAARPVLLPAWQTFEERARNVLAAKMEMDDIVAYHRQSGGWSGTFEMHSKDIEELAGAIEPVDYIFTDPPYGGHISYLDLSTLWNVWLDFPLDEPTRRKELIVGGEMDLTEEQYVSRLEQSMRCCFAMLRPEGWLSVVFQHWNIAYFRAILVAAASSGGELKAAISQVGDPIWSMHKKKNQQSVLAGEMILTFNKTGVSRDLETGRPFDVEAAMMPYLCDPNVTRLHGEYLFNQLIIAAWHAGAIDSLSITREQFAELMRRAGWSYSEGTHEWMKGHDGPAQLNELWDRT